MLAVTLFSILKAVALFLPMLTALIFVHELGHFIFAKLFGIRVDEFAIGFPPRIFSFKKGETTYSLNITLIGGYVKIFGEDPTDASLNGPGSELSFVRKPRFMQAATLVAGIGFNIIFAWVLITGAFMAGVPAAAPFDEPQYVTNIGVVVVDTVPHSPAAIAGFEPGDRLITIHAQGSSFEVTSADNATAFIGEHSGSEIAFDLLRGNKKITLHATPEDGIAQNKKAVGISLTDLGVLKLPPLKAAENGLKNTYDGTIMTAKGLFGFFKSAIVGKADFNEVTGPIGIVSLVGKASQFGLGNLLNFTAYISITLAIVNILPFPALDGGRLAVVIIEGIIRRPLNYKYVNMANIVGFILLLILIVIVSSHDILRLLTS